MYCNERLPDAIRERVEAAVSALVDHPDLPVFSLNPYNSVEKIALVCGSYVYEDVADILYSDAATADRQTLSWVNVQANVERLYKDASLWLACELRKNHPAKES